MRPHKPKAPHSKRTQAASPPPVADVVPSDSRYAKLIAELRARLADQPSAVDLKIALAEALFRSAFDQPASPVEALRLLNQAVVLDPFRPAFYYHRGVQWHRLGDLERALSNYGRALQFDPDNPRVLHQMALAHLDAGREGDARANWDQAEKIVTKKAPPASGERNTDAKPGEVERSDNGGQTQRRSGEAKRDRASFERALFFIQCGRAEIELRAGAPSKALECLKKLTTPPGCAWLVGEMALKYLVTTGDAPTVLEWLNESLDTDYRETMLGYLQPYLDVYQNAADNGFPLRSSKGATRSLRALRAMVSFDWARRGGEDGGGGLSALKALVEKEPEDDTLLDAYLALLHDEAAHFYEAGSWAEACDLWREALLTDRHNHGITHNLALAATRAKDEDNYEKWWDKTQRLWYTRHLILPESETYRVFIAEKHLAFATKAAGLADKWDGSGDPLEAVSFWVDEMERYFLSEQYSFACAYYLLGVPLSADDEVIRQAHDSLKLKTERYSDTLPDLKDTLKRTRLKQLDEAYKSVRDAAARKAYKPARDRDEIASAELLRKRKVGYIIAVSNLLKKQAKALPLDAMDKYARLTKPLLEHPYLALQRLFQDELKAEADVEASEEIRETLAIFYFEKCYELVGAGTDPDSDDIQKVKQLLNYLRELNPCHWESLFNWAQLERAMGNEAKSVELAGAAYEACPDRRMRERIKEYMAGAEKDAEFQNFVKPAEEHMNRGRWAEALPLLFKAIKLRPKLVTLYIYAARCLMGLERWGEALAQIDQADAISPRRAVVYLLRANCLLHHAVEEMSQGRKPRSKKSVAKVRKVLEEARQCPDFADQKEDFKNLEQQLGEVESKLG